MRAELVRDYTGGPMLMLDVMGWHVRVFVGRWCNWPFAWHRWGFYAFGAGPLSVNVWPPRKEAP